LKCIVLWQLLPVLAIGQHSVEAFIKTDPAVTVLLPKDMAILTKHTRV